MVFVFLPPLGPIVLIFYNGEDLPWHFRVYVWEYAVHLCNGKAVISICYVRA
jgi:hypothetical protein